MVWFNQPNTFASSEKLQPIWHLLQPDTPTVCINHMNNLFQKSKLAIIHEIENGITIFDKTKPTSMATDLSMTFSKLCSFKEKSWLYRFRMCVLGVKHKIPYTYLDILLAMMVPMIQSMMRKYLPSHLPLPTTYGWTEKVTYKRWQS